MSDQNGGKTETSEADTKPDAAPDSKPDANFSQNRVPPVIEGEAEDVTPPQDAAPLADDESVSSSELKAESEAPAEAAPSVEEPARRGGAFRPIAILIGAVALGGGAYYLWDAYTAETPPAAPAKIAETATPMPAKPAVPPTPEKPAPLPQAPEPPKKAEAEKAAPTPPASETPKKTEAPAPAEVKSVATPTTEPAKPAGANGESDKAIAAMATKLAATQTAVDRLSQRLQTLENQVAAPKNDARATLSARDAGPNNAGEAAARLVVAQSLLTALRQGDDYSTQLTALQNFGVESARLAPLRAGLAAPNVDRLVADFTALAPKLVESTAPPKPAEETKPPRNTGEAILAYFSAQAAKLVRVRPAGAPDKDAVAVQIEKIEKDLRAGDLVAALADREHLPAPALSLSAGWAAAVQKRLDAEAAAKAELAEALQNLTKTKS